MRFPNERTWDSEISSAALRYGVPAWVVRATAATESGFNPRAFNPEGSRGLMQILESTARRLGFRGALGDDASGTGGLYSPRTSIDLGTRLLGQLRGRWPTEPWDRIYGAYNAGLPSRAPERHLENWRRQADYFRPGWRTEGPPSPFGPEPAARPSSGSFLPVSFGGF